MLSLGTARQCRPGPILPQGHHLPRTHRQSELGPVTPVITEAAPCPTTALGKAPA